jgi:hypothetical protein
VLFSSFFWQGAALGLTAAATPGSLQTLLISETLLGGFKRGPVGRESLEATAARLTGLRAQLDQVTATSPASAPRRE